jgi:hypothetical protein
MKRALFVFSLVIFTSFAFGQFKANKGLLSNPISKNLLPDNQYHLQVGTQFWAAGKNFYGNTTYINPSFNYKLSEKFTLIIGGGMAYSSFTAPLLTRSGELLTGQNQHVKSLFAYAAGQYHLNPRLNINGMVMVQQDIWGGLGNQTSKQQYKDVLLGFDYKVAPGFTFSGQVGFSNRPGYNPFMPDSYGNGFYNNGFYNETGF